MNDFQGGPPAVVGPFLVDGGGLMRRTTGRKTVFLRASRDIERVKRHGSRISTALFNLLAYKFDEPSSRVGIVVGKRFGTAVRRNRAKRLFRELVRSRQEDFVPGLAVLIFPKREALLQPFAELKKSWEAALERAHLLRPKAQ